MRLLFISNLYPPYDLGGFEQWCYEVTEQLRRRGHSVHVLASRFGIPSGVSYEDGVSRSLFLQADLHYYRPVDFFLKRSQQERANSDALRRAVEDFAPGLIVVWGMWNLSRNIPHWAEQWMPGRVAYYVASYWPADTDIHEEYWRLPARHMVAELAKRPVRNVALGQMKHEGYPPKLQFEHVMCCSSYVRDTLRQAGKLSESAGVIYGGIDPEPFLHGFSERITVPEKPLRLLYFGGLFSHKGVHTAIEAMALLKKRGMIGRVDLTVLGGGHPDYETYLRQKVEEADLSPQVHLAGRVPRKDIPIWLRQFDVFLFTSLWPEPFGRTIIEAMAAGLTVIGSDVGGSREIFEMYDRELLFSPEDSRALADRIIRLTDDPQVRQSLAQTGHQIVVERFTLRRMVDEIETWLQGIVD